MRQVGAYEAKTRLSELLEEVRKGGSVTISKHGVPVALLVPVPASRRQETGAVIAALRDLRRGITLGGISLRELIEEGRR